jgi:hypothetical protein
VVEAAEGMCKAFSEAVGVIGPEMSKCGCRNEQKDRSENVDRAGTHGWFSH